MRSKNFLFIAVPLILFHIILISSTASGQCLNSDPTSPVGIVPLLVAGNTPDVTDFNVKIDPPTPGTYALGTGSVTFTINDPVGGCGQVLTWSVTGPIKIDHVYMKGGNDYNDYSYTGINPRPTTDGYLHCPLNNSGKYADVSHINFVFHYELDISKTANTTFTRTWNWTINKSVNPDTWNMFTGDQGTSLYTVSVDKTGYTDSDWGANGTITIANNTPLPATITSISDIISPAIAVSPSCGITLPYVLAAGATLNCTYTQALPDGSSRTNTVTVVTSSVVLGGSANASITFGEPTTVVNGTINVTDTNGESWSASDDATWTYERTFTCDDDEGTIDNTATITETGQSDDASVTVNCYALSVTKDAATDFTRTWDWTIDKSGDQTALTLSEGQSVVVNYTVTVGATYTDSDWGVAGNISINNPAPIDAVINSVSDLVSPDIAASVDCSVTFPYTLAAGGTLNCTYSADLPDATSRTNTATATLQNYAYDYEDPTVTNGTTDFSGSANVEFGDPTTIVDECIDLTDSQYGDLGTVCSDAVPATFNYSLTVGPYEECGDYSYENTASFATDAGATGFSSWLIDINVRCPGTGCTLTPGYWKTHSALGPAPYDDNWANLGPLEEQTIFFLSGQTYYEVLWTPPAGGNCYYILAHAYIAAELNQLNGASIPPEALLAFNSAATFFSTKTPAEAAAMKGGPRNTIIGYATILDNYNNGLIGPGHCSEDDGLGASSLQINTSDLNKVDDNNNNNQVQKKEYINEDKNLDQPENDNKPQDELKKGDKTGQSDEGRKAHLQKPAEEQIMVVIPDQYTLDQNYPNPFNPVTTISFGLPEANYVSLKIYDMIGNEVAVLVDDTRSAGVYKETFDASELPSGIYIYKIMAGSFVDVKKMVLIK